MTITKTLDQAIAEHLAHLAERNAIAAEKQRQEQAEREARCREVAWAITLRLISEENIETAAGDWFVNEVESGVTRTYACVYNADKPGSPLDGDHDDPGSGVVISNLNRGAVASFNTVGDADGAWRAWHKCTSGRRFKTFVAAITFAFTGKS